MKNISKGLVDILNILEENKLVKETNLNKDTKIKVSYISYDSTDVIKNTLFFCKGARFKEEYLISALGNGVNSYISEIKYEDVDPTIPYIIVNDIRHAMVLVSIYVYNRSFENFKLIGITGTKGKTTTTYFLKNIFDIYSNKKTAYISSISTYTGTTDIESRLTTPETIDLHKYFYETSENNLPFLTMEVASQGYKVGRVDGVTYDVGAFLNISEDHISPVEHPDLQDYLSSKLKLLENSKINVVNADTEYLSTVLAAVNKKGILYTYGSKNNADYYAENILKTKEGYVFDVISDKFNYKNSFEIKMHGLFNIENALCAIVIAKAFKIDDEIIKDGILRTEVHGRMTTYVKDNVTVIVDYAHNYLSFEKLYESIKNDYKDHKIVTVFGCPGNKAYTRRRDLGLLSAKNSDKIYLTEDDPQYEKVSDICDDIITYIEPINKNYIVIEDREEAIKKSIEEAINKKEKIVIAIAGKGAEKVQKVNGKFELYKSDMVIVEEIMKE